MPYVEVWVDPEMCDGKCGASKEAEALKLRIDEAVNHLRYGYVDAAMHALTDNPSVLVKNPDDISKSYAMWKDGKLPGFTNYRRNA